MRQRGTGRIFSRSNSKFLWAQYSIRGEQVRVSTREVDAKRAEKFLKQRVAEVLTDTHWDTRRTNYADLREGLLSDYAVNRRKWLRIGKDGQPYLVGLTHLDDYFAGWKAREITTDAIRRYISTRQEKSAANSTINRELSLLRRAMRLAVNDGRLGAVVHFPMLREPAARKGFLEHADYQKLRQELPEHLRPVIATAFYTAMRIGEILGLRWQSVDLEGAQIRLGGDETKNGCPRSIPLAAELREMLRIEREKNPAGEHVFEHKGRRIRSFYKAWRSATARAGLAGLLVHDLRRSGLRNLVRAGINQHVAQAISGHKGPSVFLRYDIVSERDLADAGRKLETYLAQENGDSSGTVCTTLQQREKTQVAKVQ